MAGIPRMQNRRLPSPDKKNELLDQLVATIERHFCNGKTSQELEVGARRWLKEKSILASSTQPKLMWRRWFVIIRGVV